MLRFGEVMEDPDLGSDYQLSEKIGKGAYSTVWRAVHKESGKEVAVKKEGNLFDDLVDCKRVFREIKLLRLLKHPNIVQLLDLKINEEDPKFNSVSLILDLGEIDMKKILKSAHTLQHSHIKRFIYDILLALKYMHSAGVIHRDIKPGNILLYEDESVKLCDFGLARCVGTTYTDSKIPQADSSPTGKNCISPDADNLVLDNPEEGTPSKILESITLENKLKLFKQPEEKKEQKKTHPLISTKKSILKKILTSHVVTRWYRAPEVILMEENYGAAIDIWAVGCIFAELLAMLQGNSKNFADRKPLFPGESCYPLSPGSADSKGGEHDQLNVILKVLGTPGPDDYSFILDQNKIKELMKYKSQKRVNFQAKYPAAGDDAIDLLDKLLVFNPFKRLSVDQCLEHPYLAEIRDKSKEVVADSIPIKEFDFESETDLTEEKLRELFLQELEIYKKMKAEGKIEI